MNLSLWEYIKGLGACDEALDWLDEDFKGCSSDFSTLEAVWARCAIPSWLTWYVFAVSGSDQSDTRRAAVAMLVKLAKEIKFIGESDIAGVNNAIDIADKWSRGQLLKSSLAEGFSAHISDDGQWLLHDFRYTTTAYNVITGLHDCMTTNARNAAMYSDHVMFAHIIAVKNHESALKIIRECYPQPPVKRAI